ncbi:hypothetical protein F993_01503 [Acinetobacter proteolyticus]|uniref:Arc-like DNA binding domain-containing protein n=1 Tax=Acinetobacter proteolyticus TaxID=1776741 RepID=A0ABP2TP57_9GAMM|nr:Arc family DNA-binding protein [Acinetobacter proteolyticus]ENU24187.1 hypothetical protein F993_01503 [Acinetobacter proteolyticus]
MSKNGGHLTVQYNLRWSEELRDKVAEVAKENTRSMNQEVVARLEKSFESSSSDITQIPTENLMMELTSRFKGHSVVVIDNQDIKKAP